MALPVIPVIAGMVSGTRLAWSGAQIVAWVLKFKRMRWFLAGVFADSFVSSAAEFVGFLVKWKTADWILGQRTDKIEYAAFLGEMEVSNDAFTQMSTSDKETLVGRYAAEIRPTLDSEDPAGKILSLRTDSQLESFLEKHNVRPRASG